MRALPQRAAFALARVAAEAYRCVQGDNAGAPWHPEEEEMNRTMGVWREAWRTDPMHPRRALPPEEMKRKERSKLLQLAP